MINTEEVIAKLASCPLGKGWQVVVWKDGSISSVLGRYNENVVWPSRDRYIVCLSRDRYGDLQGWETDADLWNAIEEEIEAAGGECYRGRMET